MILARSPAQLPVWCPLGHTGAVRTTLNLDDSLIEEAARLTGIRSKTQLIHEALRALISRETARWLARQGGRIPALGPAPPRRRPESR